MLHVTCYPIIFSLLLCFWEGLAERLNVKFFSEVRAEGDGAVKEGDGNGDVEEDGGVGEFVPLCYGARGWSGKLQETNLVAIQGWKLSPPLSLLFPARVPQPPEHKKTRFHQSS
jgi:hypothetical protein